MGIASALPVWLYVVLHYAHVLLLGISFLIAAVVFVPFVTQYISFDYITKLPACLAISVCLLGADIRMVNRLQGYSWLRIS